MDFKSAGKLEMKLPQGVRVVSSMDYNGKQWTLGLDGDGILCHVGQDWRGWYFLGNGDRVFGATKKAVTRYVREAWLNRA